MRIVHLCEFSTGICGTWSAVYETAKRQVTKKHDVYVLSSNIERGTGNTAAAREVIDNIKILRFPMKFSLSMNYLFWDFENELVNLKPDIIHAHVYRHWHSTKAIKIGKRLRVPVILTTHAPFKRKRGMMLGALTSMYDLMIGRRLLKRYAKIIALTKWEQVYLKKLGCPQDKLIMIPNGIPSEFFKALPNSKKNNIVLFLGRLAPLKRIDTLIVAIKDLDVLLKLAGPSEGDYIIKMKWLVRRLGIEDKVQFLGPIHDLQKKIDVYNHSKLFVLPSETEGMPQVLIEAMSLGVPVLGADNNGIREVIQDEQFLFPVGDYNVLKKKIKRTLEEGDTSKPRLDQVKENMKKYDWDAIVERIEKVYDESI